VITTFTVTDANGLVSEFIIRKDKKEKTL
jgi:hypothetical protein